MGPSSAARSVDPSRSTISFWRDIGHALRGKHYDYTRESPNRAILLLAAPMVLEMLMQAMFAIFDVFWVSRLGRDAIAIVGLTESVMNLIYSVAIGISIAATAIVARRIGEKDYERAAQSAAHIIILGAGVAIGLGLMLGYFAVDILELMGASPSSVSDGADFARLMFGGNLTAFLIFVINAIFRGAGDAALAMRTLLFANALNIVLAPCFIFGWGPFPELGVTGAAVATNIGRGIGVLYQLAHVIGLRSRIRLRPRHFRLQPDLLVRILSSSGNGIGQMLIGTTSWIVLFKILAAFGSAAVAGYTITVRVVLFALLPAWGLASAAATLVGQNLGALQPDRAQAAVALATRLNLALLTVIGGVFALAADPIVRLFTADPQVLVHAVRALRIFAFAFPLYAAGMCFGAAFSGAGDTWTPTRTSFFCLWLGQIPLAWLLSETFQLGPLGVFIAVPASLSALAIWNYILFKQGRWKLQRV
jgi:putative MATE family efflux protein